MPREISIKLIESDIVEFANAFESRGVYDGLTIQRPMFRDTADGIQEACDKLFCELLQAVRNGEHDGLIKQCAMDAQARRLSLYS